VASHLLDTHVVIWLGLAERLGPRSIAAIAEAQHKGGLAISAITAWEVAQLLKRGRLALDHSPHEWLEAVATALDAEQVPVDFRIGSTSIALPGELHRDPADRILAATARLFRLTLVTRDTALLRYADEGHIEALRV